jgi:flagellar basal-body rod modification protein FlgD
MAESTSNTTFLNGVSPSSVNGTAAPTKKKNEVGKDEFLQLLVTQLKNQDPLDPMKNEDFAVNLAQFSQLEQLISINGKIGSAGGDSSSLSTYLGKEVTLTGDQIQFKNGDGGLVKFNLLQDATDVKVQLTDKDGRVRDEIAVGNLKAGKQAVALTAGQFENGTYGFKILAKGSDGAPLEVRGSVAGLVSGFVPGPQPTLIVSGREVDPSEVVEVSLPSAKQTA